MAKKVQMPKGHVITAAVQLLKTAGEGKRRNDGQWVAAAKFFKSQGWTSSDITKDKIDDKFVDNRNFQRLADLHATIIAGFSKTAQHMLSLSASQVSDLMDAKKAELNMYKGWISGTVGAVATHMRKMEDKPPRTKKEKNDTGAAQAPDFTNDKSSMHGWSRQLNALKAGALIVRNDKDQTMTAADATELQNALTVALAIIGKYTG